MSLNLPSSLTHPQREAIFHQGAPLLIIAAIAYFTLPVDVIPEELEGPCGYIDDIFFSAWVAQQVMGDVGEEIVLENWGGECPVVPLIRDLLSRKEELLRDQKQKVLTYVGKG